MTLDEQRDVTERALGERMLNRAFVILHQWLQEIGFMQYGDRLQSLEQNYEAVFRYYLSSEDPDRDKILDDLTGATYRLVDEVYCELCLKRGRYPQMVGFNEENTQSVVTYFASCVRLRDEDYDFLRKICISEPAPALALLTLASQLSISRDIFSEQTFLFLIEAVDSDVELISSQTLAMLIMLLVHYDVRIDFFPTVQSAFLEMLSRHEDSAFDKLLAIISSTRHNISEILSSENLPTELETDIEQVVSWIPKSEEEYATGLIMMMPETWVFDVIVGEDEERQRLVSEAYLRAGVMDLWWDNLDEAEQILLDMLRSENPAAQDFIHYGHICFVRGDRLLAYENYREARRMIGSSKEFLACFRPERRFLIDKGVTLEDVYLMEDHLLHL